MQDGTIFQTATQWRLPFHRWWSIGCNCHGPGFNVETVEYKNISFTVWDLGGQDKVLAWCLSIWCILYEKCLVLFSYTFFIHFRTRYMQIHYWICRTTCGFHIFNGGIQKNKKKCAKELHRTHLIPDTTILMNKTQSSITNKIHHCSWKPIMVLLLCFMKFNNKQ
jgi:hypothetical protein